MKETNIDSSGEDSKTSSDESMSDEEHENGTRDNHTTRCEDSDEIEELDDQVMKELLEGDDDDDGSSATNSSHTMSEDGGKNAQLEYVYEYSPSSSSDGLLLLMDGQKPLTSEQLERIQTIENAATKVHDVIQKYSNAPLPPSLDPNHASNKHGWKIDDESAWANTSLAMEEIVRAREDMIEAWGGGDNGDDVVEEGKLGADDGGDKNEWWKSILNRDSGIDSAKSSHQNANNKEEERGDKEKSLLTKEEQDQFQQVHMEWATNAFEEELDALRKGQLENLTSSRRQKKKPEELSSSSATAAAAGEVELDPTQYSFVVASKKKGKAKGEHEEEEEMAAAAMEEIDVQVVADMIQSGSNFLSGIEKRMLLSARQRCVNDGDSMDVHHDDDDVDDHTGLTLHERRKREIGFLVE